MNETQTNAETKMIKNGNEEKQLFSIMQLLNFCLGFFGLQFAWQMRIILSGPVTESLGASPFIFGLIWLAGPVTGMVVQPIIGALSDSTHTRFGKRTPYLLAGSILASLALWAFPNSAAIANKIAGLFHIPAPALGGLLVAAIMIWIIDACINAAQGPYRALIPDLMPQKQHSLANSYLSLAIGAGSVIAAGVAPFLKWAVNYQMSIEAQFIMGALAFSLAMIWTCLTISESKANKNAQAETIQEKKPEEPKTTFIQNLKTFFASSPEVAKICTVQLFTWIGVMSMMIFYTQYAIHTLWNVPDLTTATEAVKKSFETATLQATNFSSISFAVFNFICLIVSIPIGILSSKFGNKKIHIFSLVTMAIAFIGMGLTKNTNIVLMLMGLSGIGWASICSLPFAMLTQFTPKGAEGSVMGIFNIFIAGPQVLVCTLLAWFISKCTFTMTSGVNYHWEYAFIIGAVTLIAASFMTMTIKEKI